MNPEASKADLIDRIEAWIDATNRNALPQRQSCARFADAFHGYFSREFLEQAWFVLVDAVPRPDFPQLRELAGNELFDLVPEGITYGQTYYLLRRHETNLRLHFHELVHVAQWRQLGAACFLRRYLGEVARHGYRGAPLERLAYELEGRYGAATPAFDVPETVRRRLPRGDDAVVS